MSNRSASANTASSRLAAPITTPTWSPGARSWPPIVRGCVETLLAGLAGRDACDVVADFAELLPQRVMARFLGLPDEDLPTIRRLSLQFSSGFDSLLVGEPGNKEARVEGAAGFLAYLEDRLIAGRGRTQVVDREWAC